MVPPNPPVARRRIIGAFALTLAVVMLVDAMPWQWPLAARVKKPLSAALSRVGLWQGEWSMFAPNPVINNGWLTVEMRTMDGHTEQWESPFWSRSGTWDKFVRFRHVNFYNRLPQLWNIAACDDFLDYHARRIGKPIEHSTLYRNQMQLIMPEDRSLPPREEAQWQLVPQPWVYRQHQP